MNNYTLKILGLDLEKTESFYWEYGFKVDLYLGAAMKAMLAVAWDNTDKVFKVTEAYYETICDYMQFTDCGMVPGGACGAPEMTRRSPYIKKDKYLKWTNQ